MNATQQPAPLHVAVWLDHEEAYLFFEEALRDNTPPLKIKAHHHHHKHHPTQQELKPYFADIYNAIHQCPEILLTGPGHAKLEFQQFLTQHHPNMAEHIVGIEILDHPTENQIRAFANKRFKALDKQLGTCPL